MRVLVAEDGIVMRQLLLRTLQAWDYEVVEAENGAIAWEHFQQKPFQLVLTDWIMPEMDGLDLIRHIRSNHSTGYVYIILLTAKSEKKDLVIGMEAGADDFLVKPVDPNELRVRIREGERIVQLEQELAAQNRQLRETQAALVQSEKLASLGQMAAGMAHEINNPVALVANNLAVLKRDVAAVLEILEIYHSAHQDVENGHPDLAQRAAALIQECDVDWIRNESPRLFDKSLAGLQRVRDVVQNLREFARLDEAVLDELDINEALNGVVEILQHELQSQKIELKIEAGQIPSIVCQPAKIQQVFHHLLLNAIQASSQGEEIVLRTSEHADTVKIEVQDHGGGITSTDIDHVFEPFFTTRSVGSGKGLGLAVSYAIIRDHGGTIDVSSTPGAGSTFRVQLPVTPEQQSAMG